MANPPPKIRWAIFFAVALLALAVRLPQLGERPMHTDEAVNAYITGELLAGESFHYDPQDRHGPALFVLAEPIAKLLGAKNFSELTETQLRLTPVIAGSATVLLFGAGVECLASSRALSPRCCSPSRRCRFITTAISSTKRCSSPPRSD